MDKTLKEGYNLACLKQMPFVKNFTQVYGYYGVVQSKRNGFVIFINKYEQQLRNFDYCFTKEAIGQSDVVIKTWVKY